MAHRKISVGNIDKVSGEVNIAAGDIIKNIKTIHQRALTAAEEATRARKLESKLLAQGIATLVQNLSAQASEGAQSDSPYKGLLPYGLNEAEIFYGRDKAKKDLLDHIKQSPLTVLHAESGAGKSSLLQAGIAAQLIANGHLTVYLRPRDADPVGFIKRMFLPELTQAPALAKASLQEFLRQICAMLGSKTTLYLLLDQFEEFFNLLDKNEREPFLESLADCLSDPSLKVRWVLALRAEALSKVAELETVGIAPFKNMYSLHRLSRAEAQEAIIEPARRHGIVFEPALIDHILNTLTTNGEVTPTHLQLVCSALTDDLPADQTLTLTYYIDHEGDTEGILRDYLKRQLDRLPVEEQAPAWKVLRALITADRLRDLKTYDELVEELKLSGVSKEEIDLVLARLVERRLLATQPATTKAFELAHDYLVKEIELDPQEQARKAAQELLIQETRSYQRHKTLLTSERLAVIEPYRNELSISVDAQALLNESRKSVQQERRARERGRNLTLAVSLAVAIVMSLLAFWGFRSSEEATKQAATANAAITQAVEQQAAAQAASTFAFEKAKEAEEQARIALARQLAVQAQLVLAAGNSNQMIGILLAAESMQIYPSSEAAQILLNSNRAGRLVASMFPGAQTSLVFSPDGTYLVSSGFYDGVHVWEAATGKELVYKNYRDQVKSAAFSPDGRYVLSVSCKESLDVNTLHCWDVTITVWEALTGQEVFRVTDILSLNSVVFSPDGRFIVWGGCNKIEEDGSVCQEGAVHVVETSTGQEISRIIQDSIVYAVAVSLDGNYMASGSSDGTVRIWEINTGEEVARMAHDKLVTSVAFSSDGTHVASTSYDGTARVWNIMTGEEVSRFTHNGRGEFVTFSPDGQYILFWQSYDNTARISEVSTGREISHMTHDFPVSSAAFSPDGKYVISGSSDARVWKTTTGEEVTRMSHDSWVNHVAFSPDGRHVASGDDSTIRFWEALAIGETAPMRHDVEVNAVAFSPDGRYILSGGCDELDSERRIGCIKGTARVWDVVTRKEVSQMVYDGEVIAVAFSPDGKSAISGGFDVDITSSNFDATVRVWEIATGREVAGITFDEDISSLAFSPDGRYVVTGSYEGLVSVWETAGQQKVAHFTYYGLGGNVYVSSIAFSPDGTYVAAGYGDNTVRILEIGSGKEVSHIIQNMRNDDFFGLVNSVAFSPDGRYIVSDAGGIVGTFRVWEAVTGDEISRMIHEGVNSIAFSPDGRYVVSGGYDGTARVWEAVTGDEIARMIHKKGVASVAFSPDGRYIVSGSCDETDFTNTCTEGLIRIWVWQAKDIISNSCALMLRNLNYDEWNKYIGDAWPYQPVCPDLPFEPVVTSTPTTSVLSSPVVAETWSPTPFSLTLEVEPELPLEPEVTETPSSTP